MEAEPGFDYLIGTLERIVALAPRKFNQLKADCKEVRESEGIELSKEDL